MISIIIPCKNRLDYLKKTFSNVVRQSFSDLDIIVVDYNCPQGTKEYIDSIQDKRINCINADVGETEWNLSASRNLGYKHSKGDKLLFIDADTVLDPDFIRYHVAQVRDGVFLTGKQTNPYNACGSCFVTRNDFEKVKGYNEVVQGWGSEDFNLYERLRNEGNEQKMFNFSMIKNIPHSDKIRNEYFGRKNKFTTNDNNYQMMTKEFKGI